MSLGSAASGGPDGIRYDCEPSRDREGAFRAGSSSRGRWPEPPARSREKYTSQLSHFPAYPNNGGVHEEPVEQKSNEEQNEAIPEELTEEQLEETSGQAALRITTKEPPSDHWSVWPVVNPTEAKPFLHDSCWPQNREEKPRAGQ